MSLALEMFADDAPYVIFAKNVLIHRADTLVNITGGSSATQSVRPVERERYTYICYTLRLHLGNRRLSVGIEKDAFIWQVTAHRL